MPRYAEIPLKRRHQVAAYRYGRHQLTNPDQLARRRYARGLVLADAVGMGKTYEALATAATLLAQSQYGRERKRQSPPWILILVPPGLVDKWFDELTLPDRWPSYLDRWAKEQRSFIAESMRYPTVVRHVSDLDEAADVYGRRGRRRYGKTVLQRGTYIVNRNILRKGGHRLTQLRRTPWDVIVVDEAHRFARRGDLLKIPGTPRTRRLLLTATPFQLHVGEIRTLLAGIFVKGGRRASFALKDAQDLYANRSLWSFALSLGSGAGRDDAVVVPLRGVGENLEKDADHFSGERASRAG